MSESLGARQALDAAAQTLHGLPRTTRVNDSIRLVARAHAGVNELTSGFRSAFRAHRVDDPGMESIRFNGSGENDFGRLRGADLVEELWSTEMQVLDDMSGAIGAIQ